MPAAYTSVGPPRRRRRPKLSDLLGSSGYQGKTIRSGAPIKAPRIPRKGNAGRRYS